MVVRVEVGDLLHNTQLGEILPTLLLLLLILNQFKLLLRRDFRIISVLENTSVYVYRGFVESIRLAATLSLAFTLSLVVLLQYLEYYSHRRGKDESL